MGMFDGENIQVPAVCKQLKDGSIDVYVPDFSLTTHGEDFIDALAKANLCCSAIYFYNLERNVKYPLTTKYDDAEKLCDNKSFATFICLNS